MNKRAAREDALMDKISSTPVPSKPAPGRSRADSAVPALGMVGELAGDELRAQRAHADELQRQLDDLLKLGSAVPLDPNLIAHGKFRDRHDLGFSDADYEELKEDIRRNGKNHQPILVRPLASPNAEGKQYEVVWGHRRHRATLELGLPVFAIIREVSDRDAVLLMSSENKRRKGLSQYEDARRYKSWIEAGLFENQSEIADAEGVNRSTISRYMAINELPEAILDRVEDPRKITGNWAAKVMQALEADRSGAMARLKSIKEPRVAIRVVLAALVPPPAKPAPRDFSAGDKRIFQALPETGKEGQVEWKTLRLHVSLDEAQLEKLATYAAKL